MKDNKNKELIFKSVIALITFVGVLVISSIVMRMLPLILAFAVAAWLFYHMGRESKS